MNAKSRIHLDALLLSEIVNRCTRFEYELLKSGGTKVPDTFKAFRDTSEFVAIASAVSVIAKKVAGHCARIESNFINSPVEELLDDFAKGSKDFNDQLLNELCRAKGHLLVTDDGDFASSGITVITANARLLHN